MVIYVSKINIFFYTTANKKLKSRGLVCFSTPHEVKHVK